MSWKCRAVEVEVEADGIKGIRVESGVEDGGEVGGSDAGDKGPCG